MEHLFHQFRKGQVAAAGAQDENHAMNDAVGQLPPRDFRALRDLMASRGDGLPKRLAQVAAFAMANPDEIAFGTVASIAAQARVQPSTLVRFSQAFGYQGFSELQAVFQERLRERVSSYDERLRALRDHVEQGSRTAALFNGLCEAARQSLDRLQESIDFSLIDAAAERLATAETIYLLAQRRSYPVAGYMSYAFGKLGVKTQLVASGMGTDAETLSFASAHDAAIAISFTPYAAATLAQARQVAERGTPLVVITDSVFSPLVSGSAVWFEVVEGDFEGFRSLTATMTLAMTLTVAVAEARHRE
jgi:DNA-binding MurR/RpiR family transcriptional regulator